MPRPESTANRQARLATPDQWAAIVATQSASKRPKCESCGTPLVLDESVEAGLCRVCRMPKPSRVRQKRREGVL